MISKKFWVPVILLATMLTSCSLLESLFQDKVVTLINNVRMERRDAAVPADLNLLPESVRETLEEGGVSIVVVDKADVIDLGTATVDVNDPKDSWVGAVDVGLNVANTLWPGIAALEAIALLFSRRKRKHYGSALSAAVPVNGKMELKDAIVSLGRAIGAAHSSDATKKVFEEEAKAS